MSVIVSKIQRSLAIRGILGTIGLCAATAIRHILSLTPSQRRERIVLQEKDSEFDRKWGVNTSGTAAPGKSDVVGSNWVYALKYQASNAALIDEALSELSIQYEHYTFIDFGSGKGRAILAASRYPFMRVIGVEYSEQLNEIARQNISRFPEAHKKCKQIEVICADAARFPIPEGPLVIFLFNPFAGPIMKEVVRNVCSSFQKDPRRIIVLYYNPEYADEWRNASFIREVRASKRITIYDSQISEACVSGAR